MKLEELRAEADRDTHFDKSDLAGVSANLPYIHGKWLKFLTDEVLRLKKLEKELKVLSRDKWMYYNGKADPDVYKAKPFDLKVLKSDLFRFIDADPEIIKKELEIDLQREKVEYINGVIKAITSIQWNIKNAIEFHKLTNGIS